MVDLAALLAYELGEVELFGLIFLLGSFSVATWSDLKRLSAQSEFVEVWAAWLVLIAGLGLWTWWQDGGLVYPVRLAIVVLFVLLANMYFGLVWRIAWGDVFAASAVLVLLPPVLGVAFLVILFIVDRIERPFLRMIGTEDAYAFMPPILSATVLVIFVPFLVDLIRSSIG